MEVSTIISWLGFIGMSVLGVLAVVGFFDKGKKSRERDADEVENRLIGLFKEQIAQLEKKVADLEKKTNDQSCTIASLTEKILITEETNEMLKEMLVGRDAESKDFRERADKAIGKVDHIENGNKEILKSINNLYTIMEKLLESNNKTSPKVV
jgi:uncharacterized coiled-coil DUF342 family protein